MSFSAHQRKKNLERLSHEQFDIAIVGGGITGAGVARDAASRGMKVALVESRDFAFGTSSRSSKLIHGGIRYLENLEFGLVFEALSERKTLFEIAPHLVHPLKFVLPIYETSKVGMFKMGLGMFLYDVLSMFDAPEVHERLDREGTTTRLPLLQQKGLAGAYAYYDAYMDDDRLTLETHRSAADLGAVATNYTNVINVEYREGKVVALQCKDQTTGKEFSVRAKHFIGSVGPWTDIFGTEILHDWQKALRPTKGVHLTFDRKRLPLKEAIVMVDDAKNRIVFGIPRHEMIIIGTTDTDYPGDPAKVHTVDADVEYILNVIEEYFPGANITRDDIIASYSGVRPLVYDGSASEGKTSREHKIWADPRNFTFVAGGKYTTYRHMAEQIVNFSLEQLSLDDRVRFSKPNTKTALNSKASLENMAKARAQEQELSAKYGVSLDDVSFLVERHGIEAVDILEIAKVRGHRSIWQMEAFHAINQTMCLNLDDFYIRRAPLFLARKDHGMPFVDEICEVFSHELGWTVDEIQKQKQKIEAHLKFEMGWLK